MKRPDLNRLRRQVEDWNARCPVGTPVEYHSVIGGSANRMTRTRTQAYVLGDHTAVCFVEGVSGCVALDALVVVSGKKEQI
jgi:hypothetical protein